MILRESLAAFKAFSRCLAALTDVLVLSRLVAAFVDHRGRMSASQAAGAIRTHACHRATIGRYLTRLGRRRDWRLLERTADQVLAMERRAGRWVFIVDQTYGGQSGVRTENTFSRANYRPRAKGSNRKQKKVGRRSCHGFVMGLLITPSGYRLPSCRCYYTKAYCEQQGIAYRTQTECAAELIRHAPIPAGAAALVLGDTAFDATVIRTACAEREFAWIVPANPERVLAGPRSQRRKVRSLAEELQATDFEAYPLRPGVGRGRVYRRLSRFRVGRKAKPRTYYVHGERRDVHSVGKTSLVFSTKEAPQAKKAVRVQKILMTNDDRLTAAEVVEWYDLRWQVELFFKEIKSTLGFDRHRFRKFATVEGWTQACLIAFVYLEWRRARALRRGNLPAADRRFWESQRTYGGCQAVWQAAEDHDLTRLRDWMGTPTGRKKLRKALRAARPPEYRAAN